MRKEIDIAYSVTNQSIQIPLEPHQEVAVSGIIVRECAVVLVGVGGWVGGALYRHLVAENDYLINQNDTFLHLL